MVIIEFQTGKWKITFNFQINDEEHQQSPDQNAQRQLYCFYKLEEPQALIKLT